MKVISFQIADSIDIRAFKNAFTAQLHFFDSDELFYIVDGNMYVSVFKYGVVSFLNGADVKISEFLTLIAPYCKNLFEVKLSDELEIETDTGETRMGYNKIELKSADIDAYRIIMLNVSQSVALDYYSEQSSRLLEETNKHTQCLEKKGTLDISGIHLKKFIGRTLRLKNQIVENLYIFDSPPETWEDENLNRMNAGLKKLFDLPIRFRDIHEELQIIKENLDLFIEIMHQRKSSALEWVVIILILVEVLNLFFEKIFKFY